MDTENVSRADLALPNPQESPSVPDIELLETSPEKALPEKPVLPPPRQTWQTLLKRELEFLGVTQILAGLICLYFGIIVCSVLHTSDFDEEVLLLYRTGYPFWGAVLFILSGLLTIMSERKNILYLVRGSLGANTLSSIVAGAGMVILILNLSNSSAYMNYCKDINEDDGCFVASFITEMVLMMLFLTVLAFFSAVLLTIYKVGEEFERKKATDERLYEELNVYSPIYSELEDKGETLSPVDA
ncbi:high affinity immunoglobulin epsilon receptor subunit beta isoform X1 [Meriones unguiculatus]|uniref:high affinity immunoglobulin epsilon receptor subunit beta isoform X1 n=1 Tax=Meriones unguiculatus TaxID=10047 RepID=UPI000B4F48D9|nr:high affinity immunoglobulin epsilon receptor subunit beta isoform X1 [Meriones unguiculatus]